jgi:glycosyl-4,4'-diaponeurosporenoate acyltransferase
VPEAGGLFGGFAKRRLPSRDSDGLDLFRRETIRAERVHWLILASSPVHALWCRPTVFAAMVVFGLGFTLPFIVIQRSNRGRLDRLLARRRAQRTAAPA